MHVKKILLQRYTFCYEEIALHCWLHFYNYIIAYLKLCSKLKGIKVNAIMERWSHYALSCYVFLYYLFLYFISWLFLALPSTFLFI